MNKKITIIFSLLFALLFFVAVALLIDRSAKESEIRELKNQIDRSEVAQENLFSVNAYDNLFFENNYEDALSGYRALLEDSVRVADRQFLLSRVEFVEDFLKEQTAMAAPTAESDPRIALNEESKDLSDTITVAPNIAHEKQDSLERKITELNRKISSRERALEKKEQLKATVIKRTDGATVQYIGDTKDGKAHGKGTGIWEASGSTYKGDWAENERHGHGVYIWKDGVRYEGDFRNDKREGKGAYFWPSGERYVGQWKNNQRNGEGILYDKDGNITYQGLWENDKPKKK